MIFCKIEARALAGLALVLAIVAAAPARATSQCMIQNSACYPWRIAAGNRETTLLAVVPNNAVTGAIYRICLCPPAKAVELVFRFGQDDVVIGNLKVGDAGPVCRDFRFETSRRSKLVLRRQNATAEPLSGCYVAVPSGP